MTFKKRVFAEVKKIPCGQTRTYKEIAAALGNPALARAVGNALHQNEDYHLVPCYRVLSSQGRLASHYKFGGKEGQRKLLAAEGLVIED
jgi:methylated-DNA-protein-cysteine methyltransferase-like protein